MGQVWTPTTLQGRCERLRDAVLQRGVASEAELAPYWPGGESNTEADEFGAWIYCYFNMGRFAARLERADKGDPWADLTAAAALTSEPMTVTLDGGQAVQVWPKSFMALQHVVRCEQRLRDALVVIAALVDDRSEDAHRVRDLCTTLVAELQAVQVWIATHPGPGVPYRWEQLPWRQILQVPEWVRGLSPVAIMQVGAAFATVNVVRLQALDQLTQPAQRTTTGAGWASYFSSLASDRGVDVETIMRERSLASLLTQTSLAADVQRRAMDAAKAEAK